MISSAPFAALGMLSSPDAETKEDIGIALKDTSAGADDGSAGAPVRSPEGVTYIGTRSDAIVLPTDKH